MRAAAIVGLGLAIVSVVALLLGVIDAGDPFPLFTAIALGIVVAVLASIVLVGALPSRSPHRIVVHVLIGISAAGSWLLILGSLGAGEINDLNCYIDMAAPERGCGPAPINWTVVFVAVAIAVVALAMYLTAAALYVFASRADGVAVGARTRLLALLLLSLIPGLNILGLIGFLITSFKRRPV